MRAFLKISPNQIFANNAAQQMAVDALLSGVFGQSQRTEKTAPAADNIAIDVSESDAGYTVYASLAGVKREDIDVKVEGRAVAIKAKLNVPALNAETETWLLREIANDDAPTVIESARRFTVRHDIDETKVVAKVQDGVLTLTLPKKTLSAAASITIQ